MTIPNPLAAPVPSSSRPARRLMLAAALSMLAFIALSLTEVVNRDVAVMSASGLALLVVELFWVSAAAMGALLATLMAVMWAMERGRDPGAGLRTWAGVLAGVMAGFILAALVPLGAVPRPAAAVVGAFLASTVFRMVTGARTPAPEGDGGGATADS